MAVLTSSESLVQMILYLILPLVGNSLHLVHTELGSLSNFDYDHQGQGGKSTNGLAPTSLLSKDSHSFLQADLSPLDLSGPVPLDIVTGARPDIWSRLPQYNYSQGQPHEAMSEPVPPRDNTTLTLGYLVVDREKKYVPIKSWKVVSGALSYAIEKINREGIVPGYNLSYVIRDIRGQTNYSLLEMSRLWRDEVVGFVGPANTCKHEALLAAAWNLPLLSHTVAANIAQAALTHVELHNSPNNFNTNTILIS